jgi:uncharacterized protein
VDSKIKQLFQPPWWIRNNHVQSCFSSVFRPRCHHEILWEQLDLPDDDFIDLCWAGNPGNPIVVLLHGLEGSLHSHYIQLMFDALTLAGWHVVLMHFRTCSGRMNRLSRFYHASDDGDFAYLLQVLGCRFPQTKICAVGFSLGGNVLMHHLAYHPDSPITAAVAVSVPFELDKCADTIPTLYKWPLLRTMKMKSIQKVNLGLEMPARIEEIKEVANFRSFDNLLTAPLHGFRDADDYYHSSSLRPLLRSVKHPTLLIQAEDDPLVPPDSIPQQSEFSDSIEFELSHWGGHVGFINGVLPWRMERWFQIRILDFLQKSV